MGGDPLSMLLTESHLPAFGQWEPLLRVWSPSDMTLVPLSVTALYYDKLF